MKYFKQQTIAFRNIITNEYYPKSFKIDFSERLYITFLTI